MTSFRIALKNRTREALEKRCKAARSRGDIATYKRIMAILAVAENYTYVVITTILGVSAESIRLWVKRFVLEGIDGLRSRKSPGRPSKLTKSQRRELTKIITKGPEKAGFPGACWRSPMIQTLIEEKFGVIYSVNYIAQLLKNMGFSYQKAGFIYDHDNAEKRKEWLEKTWPEIRKLAAEKNAHILFEVRKSSTKPIQLRFLQGVFEGSAE